MELKEKQSVKVESSSFYDRVLARTFNLVFCTLEKLNPNDLIGKETVFQQYLRSFDEAKTEEEIAFIFEAMAYKVDIDSKIRKERVKYSLYDILLGRVSCNKGEVKNQYEYLKNFFGSMTQESYFIEALKIIDNGKPAFASVVDYHKPEPGQIIAYIFKETFKKELELEQVCNEESRFYSNKAYQVNATSSIDEKGNVTFAASMKSHKRNFYKRSAILGDKHYDWNNELIQFEKMLQYIYKRAEIIAKTSKTDADEFVKRNVIFCFNANWLKLEKKIPDIFKKLQETYPDTWQIIKNYQYKKIEECDNVLKNKILPQLFSLSVLGKDEEMCRLAANHGLIFTSYNEELNQKMQKLEVPLKALYVSTREGKRGFFKEMLACGMNINYEFMKTLNKNLGQNCPEMYLQAIEIMLESTVALDSGYLTDLLQGLDTDLKKRVMQVLQKQYNIIDYEQCVHILPTKYSWVTNKFLDLGEYKTITSLKTENDFITVMQVFCEKKHIEELLDEKHDAEFIVNVLDSIQDEVVLKIAAQMVANLPEPILTAKQIERFAYVVGDERLYSVFTNPANWQSVYNTFGRFWESTKIIPLGNKDAMKEIMPYLQKIYQGYPSVYHLKGMELLDVIVCQPFKSDLIFINENVGFAQLEKLFNLPNFDLGKIHVAFHRGFPGKKLSDPNIDEGLKEVIALEYFYREQSSAFYGEGNFFYLAKICLEPQQCKKYILKGGEYKNRLYHIFVNLPSVESRDNRYYSNFVDCTLQFKKDFCAVYFDILAQEKNLEDRDLIIAIMKADKDSCKFNKESILPKTKEFLIIAKKIYEEFVENNNSNSSSNQCDWQLHLKNVIQQLEKILVLQQLEKALVLQPQATQCKTERMMEM